MKRLMLAGALSGLFALVVGVEAPRTSHEFHHQPKPRPGDSTIVLGMCGSC